MQKESPLGKRKTMERQVFYPYHWELRALIGNKTTNLKDLDDSMSDLEEAMEGMRMPSTSVFGGAKKNQQSSG